MFADLARVASSLREGTFAATLEQHRAEILRQLRETGAYTINEGGQSFTITLRQTVPTPIPGRQPR